jgi:hypothetical protein
MPPTPESNTPMGLFLSAMKRPPFLVFSYYTPIGPEMQGRFDLQKLQFRGIIG